MRARFPWIAAALTSALSLALLFPACDGGSGSGGSDDPNADDDGDGVPAAEDCNDHNPAVHPGATEPCSCDGEDDDCNGKIDDFACALKCSPPNDSDGDGYEPPADCNDLDASINPGAMEPCECDAIDQDCTGDPQDFSCDKVCHQDKDNDGFDDSVDCNDEDGDINPNAAEECACDDVDQNCDGSKTDLPDGCDVTCTDADGDGYFAEAGDCNDGDKTIHPGVKEPCECDDVDEDCSGDPLDFDDTCALTCPDIDGDGVPLGPDCDDNDPTAKPGPGPEDCACDGVDNDCNGAVDDFDASCTKTCTYLNMGEMCMDGMEPACGAGLACCSDGAGGNACVTECQGDMCDGKCPMP